MANYAANAAGALAASADEIRALYARIATLEAELAKEREVLADAKLFIEKRREVGFYDGGSRPIDRQNQLDWCNNLLSRIESILTGAAQC